jgi:hypothetical protein
MKTSTALQNARQLIIDTGWIQAYLTLNGKHCLQGALRISSKCNEEKFTETYWYCLGFLMQLSGTPYLSIWNDSPGRTVNEVVDLLDQAISAAMSEEN